MYKKISDYGLIGDMHSLALVSEDGSIDYCSMPYMDSPTVFALLLDDEKGGYFRIRPNAPFESKQEYLKDTNILSCTFLTDDGNAELIDYMPVSPEELFEKKEHSIHRCVKITSGTIDFEAEFAPRPDYAQGIPRIIQNGNRFDISYKNETFVLIINIEVYRVEKIRDGKLLFRFKLSEGKTAHFYFLWGKEVRTENVQCDLEGTKKFWVEWLHNCVGDKCLFWGKYSDMINRSLLTLKLLTYKPTGAIAAAATTSLPEVIGGERNWDYRFTWIRDASFTLKAMFSLGHIQEAEGFVEWLHGIYRKHGSGRLQIMYSLLGEAYLGEINLEHLKGYKDSKPVRIGNAAFTQKQWDIYGEVLDTALRLSDYAGKIDQTLWPFFRDLCNQAMKNWQKPDSGIWELRSGQGHFVYSKVMCWVALDRGLKIAKRYGFDAPIGEWEAAKRKIKEDVLDKGYNDEVGSFVQKYGSRDLDSSLLLIPIMGFLPFEDERVQGTIEACRNNLMKKGFLLRYSGSDGLKGEEGGFLLCNFWFIECLALSGRIEEAKKLLENTKKAANHLGLFSEEYEFRTGEMLGNFPQAFSHIGYINAVSAILNLMGKSKKDNTGWYLKDHMRKLIPLRIVLNKSGGTEIKEKNNIAGELKVELNKLHGAFFNVSEGRVDYNTMRRSESFRKYVSLAKKLNGFDPFALKNDNEKKAFWINIYNILIIHGVIYFDIKRSVLEVINFFKRIGYEIGGLFLNPDDIEHGILRGNRPHPYFKVRPFSVFDKKKKLSISNFDARIHFALVCAASSCPPIEFYSPDDINGQLDVAGRSFANRGGVIIDREKSVAYLSQIFKWYAGDFGRDEKEILAFISRFVTDEVRGYINGNINSIRIEYSPYNWNLNTVLE